MTTTLNNIKKADPCSNGWKKLLNGLNKTKTDDEPLPLIKILDNNGLEDAIWCLQTVPNIDKELRLFAVNCVRQVQHITISNTNLNILNIVEKYAHGDATDHELLIASYESDIDFICCLADKSAYHAALNASRRTATDAANNAEKWDDTFYAEKERQKKLFIKYFS